MRTGGEIGLLARSRYSQSVEMPHRGIAVEEAAERTRQGIDSGAEVLFEATFIAEGRIARLDVLERLDGGWGIDEVKSSTVKPAPDLAKSGKLHDLAFQWATVRDAGIDVRRASLVLIESRRAWSGRAEELFARVDLTSECEELAPSIRDATVRQRKMLARDEPPTIETNRHCEGCPFHAHCHEGAPEHDVITLPRITAKMVTQLRSEGYRDIREIPADYKLSPQMARVRETLVSGRPYLSDGLPSALDAIRFPAAFIDFEACQTAAPTIPGIRPYQAVCFQWSAHIVLAPDEAPTHEEFLNADEGDPRAAFCRTLWEAVQDAQTIVHYSSYEKNQLRAMAADDIPYAAELLERIERDGLDLEAIVREHVYLAEFRGKTSIKTVLPALVPTMSYDGFAIANGEAAAMAYTRMIALPHGSPNRLLLRSQLLQYCEQDTLAMVRIYERLRELAGRSPVAQESL